MIAARPFPLITQVLLDNDPSAPYLAAVFAGKLRIAPNPPSRAGGDHKWDAGPVSSWCEVQWDALPALLEVRVASQEGAGHIGRQAALHAALTGICTRPAPHWGG